MFIVILYITLTIVFIYCLFTVGVLWHWHTYRINKVRKASTQDKERRAEKAFIYPTIDILIAVRNEAQLYHTIESLAQQDYPKDRFRIILVDDFSDEDESLSVLNQIEHEPWPITVKIIRLCNELSASYANLPNKKRALTLGAKASKASFLAFTDGDCIAQPGWLKALAEEINLKSQCKMVLAGIKPIDQGGFTRHFAMLEQSALTVISGGSLIAGIPLMANGANLLLSRQVFEEINGFYPWEKKPSGDDIILLRKVHGRYPNDIAFSFHPKAIMKTKFPSDLPTFWNQRRRWASKTFTMPSKQITAIMMLMFFTQVAMALFLVLLGIGLYNQHPTYALTAVIGLAAKTIFDGVVIVNGARHVQYPLRLWDFFLMPIFQVINVFYNLVLGFQSIASNGKGYLWKGRRVIINP